MSEARFLHAVILLVSLLLSALYAAVDITLIARKESEIARARARREYEAFIFDIIARQNETEA
jgi:hypothetical protein